MPISASQRILRVVPTAPAGRDAPAFNAELSKDDLSETDIDFLVRRGVPETLLTIAGRRAASHGTTLLQELFALGFDRQRYWSMLADDLGLRFVGDLTGATLVADAGLLATDAVRLASSVLVRMPEEPCS